MEERLREFISGVIEGVSKGYPSDESSPLYELLQCPRRGDIVVELCHLLAPLVQSAKDPLDEIINALLSTAAEVLSLDAEAKVKRLLNNANPKKAREQVPEQSKNQIRVEAALGLTEAFKVFGLTGTETEAVPVLFSPRNYKLASTLFKSLTDSRMSEIFVWQHGVLVMGPLIRILEDIRDVTFDAPGRIFRAGCTITRADTRAAACKAIGLRLASDRPEEWKRVADNLQGGCEPSLILERFNSPFVQFWESVRVGQIRPSLDPRDCVASTTASTATFLDMIIQIFLEYATVLFDDSGVVSSEGGITFHIVDVFASLAPILGYVKAGLIHHQHDIRSLTGIMLRKLLEGITEASMTLVSPLVVSILTDPFDGVVAPESSWTVRSHSLPLILTSVLSHTASILDEATINPESPSRAVAAQYLKYSLIVARSILPQLQLPFELLGLSQRLSAAALAVEVDQEDISLVECQATRLALGEAVTDALLNHSVDIALKLFRQCNTDENINQTEMIDQEAHYKFPDEVSAEDIARCVTGGSLMWTELCRTIGARKVFLSDDEYLSATTLRKLSHYDLECSGDYMLETNSWILPLLPRLLPPGEPIPTLLEMLVDFESSVKVRLKGESENVEADRRRQQDAILGQLFTALAAACDGSTNRGITSTLLDNEAVFIFFQERATTEIYRPRLHAHVIAALKALFLDAKVAREVGSHLALPPERLCKFGVTILEALLKGYILMAHEMRGASQDAVNQQEYGRRVSQSLQLFSTISKVLEEEAQSTGVSPVVPLMTKLSVHLKAAVQTSAVAVDMVRALAQFYRELVRGLLDAEAIKNVMEEWVKWLFELRSELVIVNGDPLVRCQRRDFIDKAEFLIQIGTQIGTILLERAAESSDDFIKAVGFAVPETLMATIEAFAPVTFDCAEKLGNKQTRRQLGIILCSVNLVDVIVSRHHESLPEGWREFVMGNDGLITKVIPQIIMFRRDMSSSEVREDAIRAFRKAASACAQMGLDGLRWLVNFALATVTFSLGEEGSSKQQTAGSLICASAFDCLADIMALFSEEVGQESLLEMLDIVRLKVYTETHRDVFKSLIAFLKQAMNLLPPAREVVEESPMFQAVAESMLALINHELARDSKCNKDVKNAVKKFSRKHKDLRKVFGSREGGQLAMPLVSAALREMHQDKLAQDKLAQVKKGLKVVPRRPAAKNVANKGHVKVKDSHKAVAKTAPDTKMRERMRQKRKEISRSVRLRK